MRMLTKMVVILALSMTAVLAQGPQNGQSGRTGEPVGKPADASAGKAAATAPQKPKVSDAARAAIAAAREIEGKLKGTDGPARTAALQTAAAAWDKLATDFAAEATVAAQAAFRGGELWQRYGSFAQAEQDFLLAAKIDAQRFGQRGAIEAADMQRRQKRNDEALTTYGQAIALEPTTLRAQEARIWQGRLLQSLGRIDEAVGAFRKALETAEKPKQVVEAANWLAKVLIQKGDFDNAESALTHADEVVHKAIGEDAAQGERLQKSLDSMSARKTLQRARDKQAGAGKDAKALEEQRGVAGGR